MGPWSFAQSACFSWPLKKTGEREGTAVEVCRCLDVVDQLVGVSAS